MKRRPTALVILDGFGYSPEKKYNAIAQAKTPTLDYLLKNYSHCLLQAAGPAVGLPPGYQGNSEVGHQTMGAGRIIEQPLTVINKEIKKGSFFTNKTLTEALEKIAHTKSTLHIMGLLSDGGVHSHINHLFALIKVAVQTGVHAIEIHAFLDGRDTPPKSTLHYLDQLNQELQKFPQAQLASISGRYFAMDRDRRWDRTQKVYDMLMHHDNFTHDLPEKVIRENYERGVTDEFVPPIKFVQKSIKNGDGVIFFNFRPDRARQITQALIDPNFNHFKREPLKPAFFLTMVPYNHIPGAQAIYPTPSLDNTLKEKISKKGLSILSIAETEKYAHVTYFFGGGHEKPFPGETQILIPSIGSKSYASHPEMSAQKITDYVLNAVKHDQFDFYLINYANADMVGHSGNLEATIKAVQCLDRQIKQLYDEIVFKHQGTVYITADHGNAEKMFDEQSGQPDTAHTANPVPFIWVNEQVKNNDRPLELNGLSDVANFIYEKLI